MLRKSGLICTAVLVAHLNIESMKSNSVEDRSQTGQTDSFRDQTTYNLICKNLAFISLKTLIIPNHKYLNS